MWKFRIVGKAILIEPLKALLYLDMSDCQPRVVLTMAVVTSWVGADSDQFKQSPNSPLRNADRA